MRTLARLPGLSPKSFRRAQVGRTTAFCDVVFSLVCCLRLSGASPHSAVARATRTAVSRFRSPAVAQTRYLDALRKRDVYIRGLPIVTYYTPYRKHEETNSPAFAQRPALCICIFKLSSPAPGSSSARHRRPCIGYTASPWYKLCRTRLQRTSSRLPHLSFSCPSRLLGFTRNDM